MDFKFSLKKVYHSIFSYVLNGKGHTILFKYTWYIYNIWKQPKKLWGFELYDGSSVGTGSPKPHFSRWGYPWTWEIKFNISWVKYSHQEATLKSPGLLSYDSQNNTHFLLTTEEGCFWVEFSISFLFSCTNLVAKFMASSWDTSLHDEDLTH